MNANEPGQSSALQPFEPAPENSYSIEMVVHITQVPRHLIAVYCRHGLITPLAPPESAGWSFDDEAIRDLRHIERLRDEYALELPALRLVMTMSRELERLRAEVRALRGR